MMKLFVIILLATLAFVKASPPCLGCPTPLEDEKGFEKATNLLKNSLAKLAAGEGPNYTLVKVNSASEQVVRGLMYKINADIADEKNNTKTCDIEIVNFQGYEVTFNCPKEPEVKRTHA
ncbi:sarcocystatin-A-like [Stomoxys calcitrans]|uniref:Cystatin domain-containing protein n=1 Tax=Stomoxys calcitrans TaxID=35570 RepID=A0A1I8P0F5_STOCA|nr:sarcocystatin-A-like [Stomoxys calcitrans]